MKRNEFINKLKETYDVINEYYHIYPSGQFFCNANKLLTFGTFSCIL